MSKKPLRPCKHAGCSALTRDGWCPAHKPKYRRGSSAEYHRLYLLPIWTDKLRPDVLFLQGVEHNQLVHAVDELRPEQLLREPFCRECARQYPPGDPRHRTRATVVDHIVPHRGDWDLFVDPANHQSLCKFHHDQKTMRERIEYPRKRGCSVQENDT